MILIDTGPLVAMLNSRDRYHNWIRQQLAVLKPPFYTCESVISETCFLLQQTRSSAQPVFELLKRKLILIDFDLQKEYTEIGSLMKKYQDLPIDLADACLVRMSEKNSKASVVTLDYDFLVYRKSNRQIIPIIMPEELQKRRRKTKYR